MKKLFLIPLMALACTVAAWAADVAKIERTGDLYETLEDAFAAAENNDQITLLADAETNATIVIGTAEVDDAPRKLTLDMNGHNWESASTVKLTIALTHGALYLTNSKPAEKGVIENTYAAAGGITIECHGTYEKAAGLDGSVDANIPTLFTYLKIEAGVTIKNVADDGANALVIDNAKRKYFNYKLNYDGQGSSGYGFSSGVRIDIYGNIEGRKYGIKINGTVDYGVGKGYKYNGSDVLDTDRKYSPFIHVYSSAKITSAPNVTKAIAIYASGYGRWVIEGTCEAATGIYMKSGEVDLYDATVTSTWTGVAPTLTTGLGSGVNAGGSAIVVESNKSYQGDHSLTIGGDSQISSDAVGGSALAEVVDGKVTETKVENITVNGGTFTADNALVISEKTAEDEEVTVTIYGSNIEGEIQVGDQTGSSALDKILPDNVYTTEIVNTDGSTTIVVNPGGDPADVENINSAASGTVNWTKVDEIQTLASDKTFAVLQMNAGTEGHLQTLIIPTDVSLDVKRLVMNDFARIIVEPGGTLLVTGSNGAYAPNVENITLQTSASAHATLLISPTASAGKHPKCTFEFVTKSYWVSSENRVYERFGIPTYFAPDTFYTVVDGINSEVRTRIWEYSEPLDDWNDLSTGTWTKPDADNGKKNFTPADLANLNTPFAGYNLMAYRTSNASVLKYVFKGALQGNSDAELNANMHWTGFANSYSADIDIPQFLNTLKGITNVEGSIWLYRATGPTTYTWDIVNDAYYLTHPAYTQKIAPMQAFILSNPGVMSRWVVVDYENLVYNPGISAGAPARVKAVEDLTDVVMAITNENGNSDELTLVESYDFTADHDNGYDAEKYLNEDLNLYAHTDMKQGILASDNLDNTFIGFSTVKGGNFTISFNKVDGREFDLVDLEANVTVEVAEGNTYNFTADKNTVADYRFKLIERRKVATGAESINAEKKANGVYSIMGQYLGEMNIWNTLPAGVYVVNGEKRVK